MQKPGILEIMEYSQPLHNWIPTQIQNPVMFAEIYECSDI